MYKLGLIPFQATKPSSIIRLQDDAAIPCDPNNGDYARFKKEIENDESQLQDADGNTMTADDAKAYIATLP